MNIFCEMAALQPMRAVLVGHLSPLPLYMHLHLLGIHTQVPVWPYLLGIQRF